LNGVGADVGLEEAPVADDVVVLLLLDCKVVREDIVVGEVSKDDDKVILTPLPGSTPVGRKTA
jgi:hypothetical protein